MIKIEPLTHDNSPFMGNLCGFVLKSGDDVTYILTSDEESAKDWIDDIEKTIAQYQKTAGGHKRDS